MPAESMTDAELRALGDLIDTVPGPEPALTWTQEARLLAEVDRLRERNVDLFRRLGEHMDDLGDMTAERDALAAKLDAVRELHSPYDTPDDPHTAKRCSGCIAGYDPKTGALTRCAWPCSTIRALDDAPEPPTSSNRPHAAWRTPTVPSIRITGSLKIVREALCVAEVDIRQSGRYDEEIERHASVIAGLIADIDQQQPLRPDGKHDLAAALDRAHNEGERSR